MSKKMLHTFFSYLEHIPFSVHYWDGELRTYNKGVPRLTFHFNQEPSIDSAWTRPIVAIGEAYMDNVIDFKGDMDELAKLISMNRSKLDTDSNGLAGKAAGVMGKLMPEDPKKQIQHHYDIGNDFFKLWLDPTLSYSCAYFENPEDSLHEAQMNKIKYVLKKLQLKPGDRLLDIGSGWGELLIQAAEQYGVTATGITLSEEQFHETLKKIKEHKLSDKVSVMMTDYSHLDQPGHYDKVVSVGMFEHVGKDNLKHYFNQVNKLLKPGGLSLLHSIMGFREGKTNEWMTRYIFPGGFIASLRETIHLLPDHEFHLLHAESLRLHYAKTLEHWLANYLKYWDYVVDTYGQRFARMWKLYLMGCAANFRAGGLDHYQLVFTKGLNNELEMTLRHIHDA